MLDPHNIPYSAIERDVADQHLSRDNQSANKRREIRSWRITMIHILAGAVLGTIIGAILK